MNFGSNFQKWIKILYTDTSACCMNNGHATEFFKLSRGIRQGCPISALLFILIVEVLASRIRSDTEIKGLEINKIKFCISQLADDTTLFLKDDESLKRALFILDELKKCSGLKLNKSKTEIFYLGNTNHRPNNTVCGINIVTSGFKCLGIHFLRDKNEMYARNLLDRFNKFKSVLAIWNTRDLSLKGKITILKSQAISQLLYATSVLHVPDNFIKDVDKEIIKFVWNNKIPKIKTSTMINDIANGGLKLPDFKSMINCQKIMWVKRLLEPQNLKWKNLALHQMQIEKDDLKCKLATQFIPQQTQFYDQVLRAWYDFYSIEPHPKDTCNEALFKNKFILVYNMPPYKKYKIWMEKGVRVIKDIINNDGTILTIDELQTKFNFKPDPMLYNSLIKAIPSVWKSHLKSKTSSYKMNPNNTEPNNLDERKDWYFGIEGINYHISKLKSQTLYSLLISRIAKPPTCLDKWIDEFPFLNDEDFKEYYKLPYKIVQSTKTQTFQFKILNRIIPCKDNLLKWKITDNNHCHICGKIDTIEHMFYYCDGARSFLNGIRTWIRNIYSILCN